MENVTTCFVDPYSVGNELRVYWCTINGVPIYMPMGTRAITIPAEWLAAHPPKPAK